MRQYVSKLEGVDPERGDTVVAKWSDAIGQLADFPSPDKAGRVIQAFIRWGKGGSAETLPDQWENAVLKSMTEHQKSETRDYFRTCHNRERKEGGATYVETSGDNSTQAVNKTEPKEKLKPKGNSISLSGGMTDRGGLASPDCHPLSVEEARKTLAMYAPAISTPEHKKLVLPSGSPDLLVYEFANAKTTDALLLMVAEKLYPLDVDAKDDDVAAIMDGNKYFAENDIPKRFYKTAGGRFIKDALAVNDAIYEVYHKTDADKSEDKTSDLFGRALADGYLSALAKNAANPAGWILARLKRVLDAVKVLEGAKGDQKPPTEADSDGDDWD